MLSIHLILCYPLLRLPSIFPSIRALESLLVSWFFASGGKKYCSFSISISPFNENPELVSLRIYRFDLLAVQENLKTLQHHNPKTSILQHSTFFMVQFSHPCMTTGKTTALTIWTFVSKLMSLLFKTLSRFLIAFLPRNKCLWISWWQSPSAAILEPKKIKSVTVSTFSP